MSNILHISQRAVSLIFQIAVIGALFFFFSVVRAEAAIVLDGTASDNTNDTSSVAVDVSGANIDDDDLILFMGTADGSGYAMPAGFTEIARVDTNSDNVAMGYKIASSEPSSYTVNTVSGGERGIAIFAVYSGVDTSSPINATTTSTNSGTTITIGSITPDNVNSAVVVFVGADSGNDGNAIASSWPSTVTEQLDNVNGPPGTGNASMSGAFGDVIQTTALTVSGAVGWGESSDLGSIVVALNSGGISTSTSLTTGTDPAAFSIAPSSATTTNTFTFQTSTSTDTITDLTVSHRNASSTSLIEITSADGATVYGSVSNPTGTSSVITLSTNTLTATTSEVTYNVRTTPKTHAELTEPFIEINTQVVAWTGTNLQSGSDTAPTITIDNQSLPSFGISSAQSYATKVDYDTGDRPFSVTAADLDNDGDVDLAVANQNSNSVSVFLNTGDGTYAAKVDYTTGTNPQSVTAADFDGDGDVDLAITNEGSNSVSVLLNTGDGTYAAKVDYTTGSNPRSVTAADLDNDGHIDLAVANYDPDSVSVLLNNGDGTYAAKVDYDTGTNPRSVTAADLDNDGDVDLAVSFVSGSEGVSVFLNNGDGTYAAKVDYDTGLDPQSVTAADFDNDGDVDLATSNFGSDTVSVLLNNGDGTYAAKVDYTTGTSPYSITAADLDNDGDVDLAVSFIGGTDGVSILLNNGDGTYATRVDYDTDSSPYSVTAADFDGDGNIDLATANFNTTSVLLNNSTSSLTVTSSDTTTISYTTPYQSDLNSILILASTSPVTTTPVDGTTYTGGEDIGGATVACVDADVATSTADSCIATGLTAGVAHYLQAFVLDDYGNYSSGVEPAGSPVTPIGTTLTTASTTDPAAFTIAPGSATTTNTFTFQTDSGTDTITDLTIAHSNASSTSLIEITNAAGSTVYGSVSNPTGTSSVITLSTNTLTANTATTTYHVRTTPKSHTELTAPFIILSTQVVAWTGTNVQSGSDTAPTITIDNQSLPSFGISGDQSFADSVNYTTGSSPRSVTTADLDNDGDIDLAIANYNSANVSVFLNNGDGTYATKVDYGTGSNPWSVTAADFDNDGDIDLATANYNSASVSVLLNNGDGTYATREDYTTGSNPQSVTAADLDGDGDVDLAVANYWSANVSILLNNGDGTYATREDYTTASNPWSVTTADLDGDGDIDLAVANSGSLFVSVLLNNGDGTYATREDYTTPSSPDSVTTADLDNDGDIDLAVTNQSSNSASILLNNGDGTYATGVNYTTGTSPTSVTTADFDNDGDIDLAVSFNGGTDGVSILLNNGDGTYATKVDYTMGFGSTGPASVSAADFDNDGDMDFAASFIDGAGGLSIFLNNSSSSLTATAGESSVTIAYITPYSPDLNSIVILASTSAITTVPVDGTTYTGGEDVGGATVVCVDSDVATSTADSCIATGLTAGVAHYLQAFVLDDYGNYSFGMEPAGSPVTLLQTGSSTINNHSDSQANNAFDFINKTNETLFAFNLDPTSGVATTTDIIFTLSGAQQINPADFSNLRLYIDNNNDAAYDGGDTQVGGTGVMILSGQSGSITFNTDFALTLAEDYILVADFNAPERGSFLTINLLRSGVISTDGSTQDIFGSVDHIQHNRNNRGGGGGASSAIGTAAPAGNGIVTGGGSGGGGGDDAIDTNTGGGLIGNNPNFKRPTAASGNWNSLSNAYDQTDGTYATTSAANDADFTNYAYSILGTDAINGIEMRLEVSGTTAAGSIAVSLSWDGGTSWTATKNTATLSTTDTVLTVGGSVDTWGRAWIASELSNANFAVRLTGAPSENEIRVDAIQVRVHNQATGGGGGGGGGGRI